MLQDGSLRCNSGWPRIEVSNQTRHEEPSLRRYCAGPIEKMLLHNETLFPLGSRCTIITLTIYEGNLHSWCASNSAYNSRALGISIKSMEMPDMNFWLLCFQARPIQDLSLIISNRRAERLSHTIVQQGGGLFRELVGQYYYETVIPSKISESLRISSLEEEQCSK